jgi:6-phosphogluconolactonase (cycloisomerase 2 family)
MTPSKRIISLIAVAALPLLMSACGSKAGCGLGFGTGSSAGGGGKSASGATCGTTGGGGNTTALDYIYSLGGVGINGAYYTGTSILAIANFSSPTLPSGASGDMFIATNTNGKFLYQPWTPSNSGSVIYGYSISSTDGSLTAIANSPFSSASSADPLVTDPSGRFLFASESNLQQIEVFDIDANTGALTSVPGSTVSVSDPVLSMAVDGTGHYLYAASQLGDVFAFSIDQTTGAISPMSGGLILAGIGYIAAEPTGKFLIGAGQGAIQVIAIQSGTGALSSPTPFPSSSGATTRVIVHPSGNYVYAFSTPVAAVEGYALDSSGNLTALSGSPYTTLTPVNPAKMDQNGSAIVGLSHSGQFYVFAVNTTTGALTAPAPVYTGAGDLFFAVTN